MDGRTRTDAPLLLKLFRSGDHLEPFTVFPDRNLTELGECRHHNFDLVLGGSKNGSRFYERSRVTGAARCQIETWSWEFLRSGEGAAFISAVATSPSWRDQSLPLRLPLALGALKEMSTAADRARRGTAGD